MKLSTSATVLVISLGLGSAAWAAGNIELVRGEASVINRDGQPRTATKGGRVVEGETVATGPGAEIVLLTDDSGVLALRPLSRLLINKYQISATDKDTVALQLLRGALRSITGWIGKTAPKNYSVVTSTATVGIRGTDHEVVVAEEGSEPGTYDRVYSGETSLETAQGSVFVQSGQTAQAQARDKVPQLLPQAPAALYPQRETDAVLEVMKQEAQAAQASRLQVRQDQNRRSGGTSGLGNPVISAQCTPNSPAQRALDEFLRAYEQGNVAFIQQRLDPALIGYSVLVNDMMRDANVQKQTQIRVLDRQMQCGPDVSVIDFAWEKRFLDIATFRPELQRGRASVLMSGLGAGGQWRISGLTGDNPFRTSASASNLQVSPAAVSYSGIPGVCVVSGTANVSANKPYTVSPGPLCAPAGNGSCNFTHPAFAPSTVLSPPAAVTSCVAAVVTVPVTALGAGGAVFSGSPGSTVSLNTVIPASGSLGGASVGASLTCSTSVTISPTAACTSSPTQIPVNFTVSDSARAGQPSVPVQVVGSNGDRETLNLSATSPGNFVLNMLSIQKSGAVTPGNGRLEFSGPTSFTVAYRGANGIQVTRPLTIVP